MWMYVLSQGLVILGVVQEESSVGSPDFLISVLILRGFELSKRPFFILFYTCL